MRALWLAVLLCLASASALGQATLVQGVPSQATTIITTTTIAVGGTFQQILADATPAPGFPSLVRRSINIENNNTNGHNCWVFPGRLAAVTTGTAALLLPGGSYSRYWPFVPAEAFVATCAGSTDTLYVETQ